MPLDFEDGVKTGSQRPSGIVAPRDRELRLTPPSAHTTTAVSLSDRARTIAEQEIRRFGVWAESEDLAQEGLARLHAQTREIVEPEAWLRTVIRTLVIDQYRREYREGARTVAKNRANFREPITDAGMTTENLLVQRQFMEAVLSFLDERDRQVLLMRGIIGHSSRRVATLLRLPSPAAVDQAYLRAKRRLKAHLEQRPDLLEDLRN